MPAWPNLWRLIAGVSLTSLAAIAACAESADSDANRNETTPALVRIDPETRYQTIEAWPVYPRYWEHDKENNRFDASFAPLTERVSQFLVDEVGINGARVEIWSGLENPVDHWSRYYSGQYSYTKDKEYRYEKVNDNDDPNVVDPAGFQFAKFDYRLETMVLPIKRAVEARSEKFHVNVNYVDFKWGAEQGTLSHADNPEEFAEFVLVFFERLRDKYGIVPDSFEIVLEPDNTHEWRGRQIGNGLIAVKRRLAAAGFAPEFVAPSAAYLPNALKYFDQMTLVPGAVEALDTFAYHRYGTEHPDYIEDIAGRARIFGLKTAMLEKVGGGIDELLEDLTLGNVVAWQQWAVAGLADRKYPEGTFYVLVDMQNPAAPEIVMPLRTRHLAQVFKHVRAGAVRIDAQSDAAHLQTAAFVNAKGGITAILRAKERGGAVRIEGLRAGRYGLSFSAGNGGLEDWPDADLGAGGILDLTLPGPGVLAVFAR